jgi:hypothetical protein
VVQKSDFLGPKKTGVLLYAEQMVREQEPDYMIPSESGTGARTLSENRWVKIPGAIPFLPAVN